MARIGLELTQCAAAYLGDVKLGYQMPKKDKQPDAEDAKVTQKKYQKRKCQKTAY